MPRYRVAVRFHDMLVTSVRAEDEDEARKKVLLAIASLCATEEESTVEVLAVAEVSEGR